MYSMKPINESNEKVEIPDCMYTMKSLYSIEQIQNGDQMTPAMRALEERQIKILQRLQTLENEVRNIGTSLGHKFGEEVPNLPSDNVDGKSINGSRVDTQNVNLPDGKLDFVISISPKQQSLSPLLIGDLLRRRGVSVAVPVHVHSSCASVTKQLLQCYGENNGGRLRTSTRAKVFLTIVIKEDPFCPSMMYSPILQTRIIGESNIARCLSRFLLPDLYDSNDAIVTSQIDRWLDVSLQIQYGKTKEKDAAMKTLNAQLGKNSTYLCYNRLTLADIVVLSSLLSNAMSFNSLPKNVKAWYKNASSNFSSITNINVPESWSE